MSTAITRVELRYEQDVVSARSRARLIAEQLGFDKIDQTRISTAVSEIARNAFQYAGGGEIEFLVDTSMEPHVFAITVRDHGKGIPNLDEVLEGRFASETGMGVGIIGSKRLLDHFHIDTQPGKGTTVFLGKNLPVTAPQVTPALLTHIADVLAKTATQNPFEEIRLQNQDLIRTLEELRQRQEESIAVNRELEDTNRGVVALYAELDDKAVTLTRANEALARSEERYRTLSESSPDQIFIDGRDGTIQYVNTAALKLFHLSYDQVVGKLREDLFPPEIFKSQEASLHQVFETGESIRKEEMIQFSTEKFWIDTRLVPLKDEAGNVTSVLGIARDNTKRKKAEEALRTSEARFRELANSITDIYFAMDKDLRYTYWNKGTEELTGIPAQDAIGKSIFEILPDTPETRRAVEMYQDVLKTDQSLSFETEYNVKGKQLCFENNVYRTNHGIAVISKGITERKEVENEIRARSRDLEKRVEERTTQLNKTLGEKETLLKEIHHRVKNNLQIIASLLNLQSQFIKDEQTLAVIKDSQNRIKAMALIHEKIYQSKSLDRIDYGDYLEKITRFLFESYGVSPRKIALKIHAKDIVLHIDKAIPCSLIINELVSNSFKHAFPNDRTGVVQIDVKLDGDTIHLLYSDNGIGLPEGVTLDRTESLGMRLISGLTQQLKGTVEIQRGGGTTFLIAFNV